LRVVAARERRWKWSGIPTHGGSRYDTVRVLRSGMHLTPAALADLLLPVQEVLA
jgi:hypothetical protein